MKKFTLEQYKEIFNEVDFTLDMIGREYGADDALEGPVKSHVDILLNEYWDDRKTEFKAELKRALSRLERSLLDEIEESYRTGELGELLDAREFALTYQY